jgi:predicted ATPase/DNA-binding winged helix-turn-helix (wHTH) protein/tetratricopeptide (TPR) repeat protein
MAVRFGDVSIDVDAHELRRSGDLVDVQPQVLAVLLHLIEQRDRVVSKEELLDTIWHHRFVTESALTSRIKSARQAIGDNGRDQRMIRTVHGKGYRFVAELDEHDETSMDAGPGVRSSPARQIQLPAQSTPFVGRLGEVRAVTELLRETDCRLLTIVGPGGMGKTRLAVTVAEQVAGDYPDGVRFVALDQVGDASEMVYAIGEAVGVIDGRNDPVTQLLAVAASKQMLVVLDNVEHLDDLALIADLVVAAPRVRWLATSRERLHLRAEWTFELGGMGVRCDDTEAETDAIDLFVGSARRHDPDFVLDEVDRAVLQRICEAVDGMPLAIELAAGWTKLLPVAEIAAELEHGFELLETDLRDVPERHRSIRAVLDGSWKRLGRAERDVFVRLSVFRGGFTRAAAAVVAGASLLLLRRLTGASMITATHDDRYVLHELLRQYGEMRLVESGLDGDIRQRHSEHFLSWLAERAVDLRGAAQRVAVEDIAIEFGNVRAAWTEAVAHGRVDSVGAALHGLWLFSDTRGNAGESGLLIRHAFESFERRAPSAPMGFLRCAHGWALAQLGELDEGRAMLQQGVGELAATTSESTPESALAHLWHGWVSFLLARNAEADEHARHALASFEADGDRWGIGRCHYLIGNNETALGLLAGAVEPLQTSLSIAESIEDRRGIALACRNLSILAGWFGRNDEARSLIDRALSLGREFDDRLGSAYALRELGKVHTAEGRTDEAIDVLLRSIEITDDIGNRWESDATADDLGNALAVAGQLDAAEHAIQRCLAAADAGRNRYYTARCRGDLGALALRRGETGRAEQLLSDAHARWNEIAHEPYAAWTLVQLGHVAGAERRHADAMQRYAEALHLSLRHGVAPFALEAIVGAVRIDVPPELPDRRALLELVANHPAASHETRESARRQIEMLVPASGAADVSDVSVVSIGTGDGVSATWQDAAAIVARHLAAPGPDGIIAGNDPVDH